MVFEMLINNVRKWPIKFQFTDWKELLFERKLRSSLHVRACVKINLEHIFNSAPNLNKFVAREIKMNGCMRAKQMVENAFLADLWDWFMTDTRTP